jgi:DivIVA domain-containing protein
LDGRRAGRDDHFVDADAAAVDFVATAKQRLGKDLPGYRISDVDSFLESVLAALRGGRPPSPAVVRAVTFPLTTWRMGYARRDVDRLIGELAQLVQGTGPACDVPAGASELIDRIRNVKFRTTHRGGYDEEEVDQYLDRITDGLSRGERGTVRQLAGEPRFTATRLRPGYVIADVDSLLASVDQALAELFW